MKTSRSDITQRQLTVRLPAPVYARAAKAAKARKMSLNAFVRSLLEEVERAEVDRELRGAYDLLGKDRGEAGAEPFFETQAEVVRRG